MPEFEFENLADPADEVLLHAEPTFVQRGVVPMADETQPVVTDD